MASSSTSSVQKSFKYDVFLSFRGKDTRKNFVDHLYYALTQKGIETYKDDEKIKKGNMISDELIEAIKDSKFYIIVFSKNYASSSWCLEELVKIMECRKGFGHTAYPVFYDVEPTEVRKQNGSVGDAFVKHKEDEAATKWREALKEASDLAGWELKSIANGHEAKFIQKIVEEISLELSLINSSVHGVSGEKSMMQKMMRGKKVLVIPDDVDHKVQLKVLAGDLNRRIEEGYPLPLPPTSPTSPPTRSCNSRSRTLIGSNVKNLENASGHLSKWKKGVLLGRGTFGHVYLGFNSESEQMCAIKEVKVIEDDQSSKESLKQLNQEITLLSHLLHPNIVQCYGSELVFFWLKGEETLSVYLEYVSGGSIHKLLQEYGPFREPVIQNYTRQILCGLAYLHGRNTVHRDIKGANILVDPKGEIKLANFGMAKHITSCTSMLSFKGSAYWMAPEVVMNTNSYNLAVDIWSLGCTILEMATSKPPWGQYEGVAAIFKIGNSKDMPDIPDHLSNDAKSFIEQCLQRDPSLRPTASKLLDHPFVRHQATTRVANVNVTKEARPSACDQSRIPAASEMHPNRNTRSFEVMGSKHPFYMQATTKCKNK